MTGGNESADRAAEREPDGEDEPNPDAEGTKSDSTGTGSDPKRTGSDPTGESGADETDSTAAPFDTLGDVSIVLALFATTITLLGAVRPLRAGTVDPLSAAIAGLAALALAAVFAGRHGRVSRPVLAPLIALASAGVGLLAIYGLSHDYTTPFGVPPIADAPALLVALLGSGLAIAAAAAIHADLSTAQLKRRIVGAAGYGLLGPLNFLPVIAWANVLGILLLIGTGTDVTTLPESSSSVFSQGAMALGTVTTVGAYLAWTDRKRSFIDLRVPTLRDFGYVVGGAVTLAGVAIVIGLLLSATGTESAEHSSIEQAEAAPEMLLVLAITSIVLIGPFEELLYRNVIQKGLYGYFSKPGAVVISSVAFASAHVLAYAGGPIGGLLVSLSIVFILSLVLGTIYARTDNLIVPALLHGLYNAYTFYTTYLGMAG